MYDEWLVSRLTKNAWALLGALLLLRRIESQLPNQELMFRAGLTKNTLAPALNELELKGLISIERIAGKPSLIRLLENEVIVDVVTESGPAPLPTQADVPKLISPAQTVEMDEDSIVDVFSACFPEEQSKYPLSKQYVKRFLELSGGDVGRVTSVIRSVAEKDGVRSPKAYIAKILREEQPINESEAAPPPELVALTERAKAYAREHGEGSLSKRRSRAKAEG